MNKIENRIVLSYNIIIAGETVTHHLSLRENPEDFSVFDFFVSDSGDVFCYSYQSDFISHMF